MDTFQPRAARRAGVRIQSPMRNLRPGAAVLVCCSFAEPLYVERENGQVQIAEVEKLSELQTLLMGLPSGLHTIPPIVI